MKWIFWLLIIFNFNQLTAQQTILPGMFGDELIEELRNQYKTDVVLSLSQAKDTIYAIINNHHDTVSCVYSGHSVFLPEGVDPSQHVFQGGGTNGINLEHSFPKSKGAQDGTQGNSDMHHLFPTRVQVNSDRGNFPFSEINDNQTSRWYYLTQVMSQVPSSNIDLYSEWVNGSFEPREDFKGNIARAICYYYTIYQQQADAADPDFFEMQRETLISWHELDPVDDREKLRSTTISSYQAGKENPYVLDESLVSRAFCKEDEECFTVSIEQTLINPISKVYQNEEGNIQIELSEIAFDSDMFLWLIFMAG